MLNYRQLKVYTVWFNIKNIFFFFSELENQLRGLDQVSDLKIMSVDTVDSIQKVRDLEKAMRLLKQEKDEAQKVYMLMTILRIYTFKILNSCLYLF